MRSYLLAVNSAITIRRVELHSQWYAKFAFPNGNIQLSRDNPYFMKHKNPLLPQRHLIPWPWSPTFVGTFPI